MSRRHGGLSDARVADRDVQVESVDPLAWMTDVLEKLVNRWPASKIEDLMPWAWGAAVKAERAQKAA